MSPTHPLLKDGPMPQPSSHEPSMEEILASIRRIIAGDQALLASESGFGGEAPRPDPNGEAFEPGSRAGARRTFVSNATDGLVGAAFNALLASRFVQHSDVVIGLTREMLRPMLKTWLDDNLPDIVERLVAAEIERVAREPGSKASPLGSGRGPSPCDPLSLASSAWSPAMIRLIDARISSIDGSCGLGRGIAPSLQ
jgi:hypothetical protein